MRRREFCLLVLGISAVLPKISYAKKKEEDLLSRYKLGSGDIISIYVLGESDLTRKSIQLTDAGTIQYPVLGEIQVKGLTVGQLERKITVGLKTAQYLKHPKVAVNIDQYRPFFIDGEVHKPGGYPFVPGLTVLKAVALAGGFKDRASKQKIYVVRDGAPDGKRTHVELDSPVYPGDVVTVGQSFF